MLKCGLVIPKECLLDFYTAVKGSRKKIRKRVSLTVEIVKMTLPEGQIWNNNFDVKDLYQPFELKTHENETIKDRNNDQTTSEHPQKNF